MDNDVGVDITPDKTLVQKLGLVGYRTEQALAELVDNSIDARIPDSKEEIRAALDFEWRRIEVSDDGAGMDREELADAMTIALGTKSDDKLGKFGMGMKSACSALGKKFTVVTSKADSDMEYTAEYDEDLWLSDDSLTWSNFKILERKLPEDGDWHGTKITISKLNVPLYPNQVSKFKESFGIRYAPYLDAEQVSIHVNTVVCRPEPPDILDGSRKKLSVRLPDGNVMTGHVALLKKRSIKGSYGIHLFKNGRLVRSFAKFGFRAHPENAKIIGELNLDHVPVNYNKSGFLQDRPEYEEAERVFGASQEIKQVIRLSQSAVETPASVGSLFDYFAGRSKPDVLRTRMKNETAKRLLDEAGDLSITADGLTIPVRLESAPGSPLYRIEDGGSGPGVIINKKSPAFKFVKNPLFLLGFIAAELGPVARDPRFAKLVEERNDRLDRFIDDWFVKPEEEPAFRDRDADPPVIRNYGLSNDLIELHDFLKDRYEFRFQFTGLSTLSRFLHNLLGRPVYTIHTVPGYGDRLTDLILGRFRSKFAAINSPSAESLDAVMDVSEQAKTIVVREYAEIKGSTVAAPEKAWVDLANDIHTHKIPVSELELKRILGSLKRDGLVDEGKLVRYAKHMKKLEKIAPLMEAS